MPAVRPSSAGRYHGLEAARGVASLAVLGFHSLDAYTPAQLPGWLGSIRALAGWGWLGVHVFFAISGWCIAERVAKGYHRQEAGSHFLLERFLRIYPTYWAALLLAILLRLAATPFNGIPWREDLPATALGSVFLVEPYFGLSPFLLVSWSLMYELGFYLCAGIALVAAVRGWVSPVLLFLFGALLCLPPWVAGMKPAPWRVLELWPDFFAGIAAWWAMRRGGRRFGFGVLAVLALLAVSVPGYGGAGRLTAIATAILLAALWPFDQTIAGKPWLRPLTWAGGVSYSLYLIHVPLISPLENLGARRIPSTSSAFLGVWGAALGAALLGAWLLNRFVEQPIERWRRTLA